MNDPTGRSVAWACCMLWDSHGQHAPTCQHYNPPSAPSDPSGAAERLAALETALSRGAKSVSASTLIAAGYPSTDDAEGNARRHLLAADLRGVLVELYRLREEVRIVREDWDSLCRVHEQDQAQIDAAHSDGWASAMETVADERRREREDVARLEARIDAVLRLCDRPARIPYIVSELVHDPFRWGWRALAAEIRAVLSSTGEPEAEAVP